MVLYTVLLYRDGRLVGRARLREAMAAVAVALRWSAHPGCEARVAREEGGIIRVYPV